MMAVTRTNHVTKANMLFQKGYKAKTQNLRVYERESYMSNLVARNRIIHALDVEDRERALGIAGSIRNYVDAIKISYPLALKYGLNIIGEIKERAKLPILACFKVADIPEISGRIMNAAIDAGADGITIHGIFGRDVIGKCIEVANSREKDVYVVTEMSNPGAVELTQQLGEKIAIIAKELGATGIVAPATRPNRVRRYREIVGNGMIIMSPGIGPQGGNIGDAILEGANFEIIGRLIYDSPDQAEAARKLSLQLKQRLEEAHIKV